MTQVQIVSNKCLVKKFSYTTTLGFPHLILVPSEVTPTIRSPSMVTANYLGMPYLVPAPTDITSMTLYLPPDDHQTDQFSREISLVKLFLVV